MARVDLSKYAGRETPEIKIEKVYNTISDYENIEKFNKAMNEIHRDYSAKEKMSCISAKKLVLTD